MKTKIIPIIICSVLLVFFASCEDSTYREYKGYKPVYMSYDELRTSVSDDEEQELVNPGKIYFKDDYLFIIEEMKGVHIYDNSDESNPLKINYLKIPGVIDMSVSGHYLYADSYVDLVVLDVEDPANVTEVARLEEVMPYTVPPYDDDYPNAWVDSEKGVVIEWELTTIKEKVNTSPIIYPWYEFDGMINSRFSSARPAGGISGTGFGVGGSMARFGFKDDILYIVDNSSMKIIDISDPQLPVKYNDFWAGWGIETMFMTEDYMFLGSQTGMFVYDLAIPYNPVQISAFQHATSCDPVIVDGDLAYITLRSGNMCGSNVNTLDVVDVSNIYSPELIATHPMFNPHGLGKDGDALFICDGDEGLKVFNASDPYQIRNNLIFQYPDINAFDVIPLGDVLILIGDDGLFQYDYTSLNDIALLSEILVTKK